MPLTYHLTLQLDREAPQATAAALHASVYHLIEEVDMPLSRELHAANQNPLSLGHTRREGFGGVLGSDGRTLQCRVHLLDERLATALTEAWAPGVTLPVRERQRLSGRVVGCWTQVTAYEDLWPQAAPPEVTLNFHSPTVLRAGDSFIDRPASRVLLHGLLRRWNAFAPQPMPDACWGWVDTGVETLHEDLWQDLTAWPKGGRSLRVPAFMGEVTYALPTGEAGRSLAALCRLAGWSGVGAKTLFGYGETVARLSAG